MLLQTLLNQNTWANNLVLNWWETSGVDDTSIDARIAHILMAEHIWLRRIHQQPWTREEVLRPLPREEFGALNLRNANGFGALPLVDLDREVNYELLDGTAGVASLEEILAHVVTHGFHHRGQIASIGSALGKPLPPTAFIQYTRLEREGKLG